MYNKLFTKILDSSIWLESDSTRIVWITLLAAMDRDGIATFSSIRNLARRANVTLQAAEEAVCVLEAPDPDSCSQECNGRRIERIDGGWLVINAKTYREIIHSEDVRKQTRIRVQRHRERKRALQSVTVTECNDLSASVSVSSLEKKGSAEGKKRAESLQEVINYALEQKMSEEDGRDFWDSMESGGWTRSGKPLKDWKAHFRTYNRHGYLASQKKNFNNQPKPHDQPFRVHI